MTTVPPARAKMLFALLRAVLTLPKMATKRMWIATAAAERVPIAQAAASIVIAKAPPVYPIFVKFLPAPMEFKTAMKQVPTAAARPANPAATLLHVLKIVIAKVEHAKTECAFQRAVLTRS